MTVENPPQREYGFVVGRFLTSIVDRVEDPDREPDWRPMRGTIRFDPLQSVHVHPDGDSALVVRQSHTHDLDDQGRVGDVESKNSPDIERGLLLAVGHYRVEPFFEGTTGISRFTIEVTAEHTEENPLDLARQFPLEVPPGFTEVVRIADRERAEAAAEAAEGHADDARAFVQTDTFLGYIADAESHANTALLYRDEAETHASGAAQSVTTAEGHVGQALTYRDEAQSFASDAAQSATTAEGHAGSTLAHRDDAQSAAGAAEDHAGTTLVHRNEAQVSAQSAESDAGDAAQSATTAGSHADRAETARDEAENITGIEVDTSVGTRVFIGGVMVYGDTGLRDMTGELYEGWTAESQILLSRENSTVTLMMYGLNVPPEPHDGRFLSLLAGFRSSSRTTVIVVSSNASIGVRWYEGDVGVSGSASNIGDAWNGYQVQWYTDDPWPTTLPGTPL